MKQATLCLLIKENSKEILLAMKKRGFGAGKWNGVGGKFDPEKDKNVLEAAIREAKEEIGVLIKDLEKVAVLDFYFPEVPEDFNWNQTVHVFIAKDWEGKPEESEEMLPKWFSFDEIPLSGMWDDDKFWLHHVLEGKKLKAEFIFNKKEQVIKQMITLSG
ncbi:DNA mismatch repair protein MutT [bacterium (Candidatus Gribaldobacteria) CG_4_10_14_0_2_um_filter_33_15]|nr:MAG: DNA mismatch repair protein MutT [bacterium (Candidatus Gribaldobacteria) CG10_big_fil_rev_8_21_14_0_10_33_41]PJA00631.1 MAG: DNA mismatch repair protein MutT [bacterium (Candidatus Gribaldobacteria) CG_4_10_14_0_2_um_filter_33_15]PJB08212.1 MAG: DNA mismatch repair protein MutT [bacterium (Candidatus Gribaldobacteria) CG_4_9_14_3_um_filter_33_9]